MKDTEIEKSRIIFREVLISGDTTIISYEDVVNQEHYINQLESEVALTDSEKYRRAKEGV